MSRIQRQFRIRIVRWIFQPYSVGRTLDNDAKPQTHQQEDDAALIRSTRVQAMCALIAVIAQGCNHKVDNLYGSGLPVEITAMNPRATVVIDHVPARPPGAEQTLLALKVFDADYRDEGHLFVNGHGPFDLFGRDASVRYRDSTRTIAVTTPASPWQQGRNSLLFVYKGTGGYRVEEIIVSFDAGSNSTPPPVAMTTPGATNGPLRVRGSTFVDQSGQAVYLAGAIVCCKGAKQLGWPLITDAALQQIADNGGNYTHIRLGPFMDNEGTELAAYRPVASGRQDLDFWNPLFWSKVRGAIEKARSLGIYVEVDLIDAWILERPALTPWARNNNVNGVDDALCANLKRAPNDLYERWLRKIAGETGEYDNVIYQVGNETMDCNNKGSSVAYEIGVANIVRDELEQRGFSTRLIGTNSHDDAIENHPLIDYISVHGETAPHPRSKPAMNNEQLSSWVSVSNFETELQRAYRMRTYFHLWRGNLDDYQYRAALQKLHEFRQRAGLR